jgi:hypothetical protein
MSIVPFSGSRPSPLHPDAFRTAQALGKTLRQLYGWYSSQPITSAAMPSTGASGRSSRSRSNNGRVNSSDLALKPPVGAIPSRVPRQVGNQVVWDVIKLDSTITTTAGGASTETNFGFSLSQHPSQNNWTALYDQWCIPQASVTFRSNVPPGSLSTSPTLYTAIDFDNIGTLGSVTLIEDFSSCVATQMFPQNSVTRSVKPCNSLSNRTTAGLQAATLARMWVDSGSNQTNFFGIRSIATPTTTAVTLSVTVTLWFAFRNQI